MMMKNRYEDPTVFDARNQFNSSKIRAAPMLYRVEEK
jgi:hypothetical protein